MKATIERATLLRSLGHVHSVVERRNTIPILSNVLLEAREDGSLRLMATDLDLQINDTIEAQVQQPGATTVSAHTLFEIARKLPEGSQVELNASEGKMQVNAGRARFNLATLPRDDFPVIAEGELPTRFELPAATLRQIIDKTRFAISTEETRYYLNGIFLHVSDEAQPVLKAAATDGHRLARATAPRPAGAAEAARVSPHRRLPPRVGRGAAGAEGRGHRRPPPRPRRRAAAGRRGRDAGRDYAAQMRGGAQEAGRRGRRDR